MKRGDLITIALQGDFGKPRPALVIQSDHFSETATVTVLPVTSTTIEAPLLRVDLAMSPKTGLKKASQAMIDKPVTVKRVKTGVPFGRIDENTLIQVDRLLALFLGIAS